VSFAGRREFWAGSLSCALLSTVNSPRMKAISTTFEKWITSRRVSRVAELIKREVSQMLLYGIKDDRVGTGMV